MFVMEPVQKIRKRLWRTTFDIEPEVSWVTDHMRNRVNFSNSVHDLRQEDGQLNAQNAPFNRKELFKKKPSKV